MRILITGGAGFIGTHTTKALVEAGHTVRILDCLDPQIHGDQADFPPGLLSLADCIRGDICDPADCERALDGVNAIYHFAARTGVGQSMYDVADYVSTNVHGTATLIETVIKRRLKLHRLILASSRAIYGEGMFNCVEHGRYHPNLRTLDALQSGDFAVRCPECGEPLLPTPTATDCPAAPLSVYALTKKHQEDYCQYAANTFHLPLTVLRYFNVYGSGQALKNPYTGVVSIFYSLLRSGKALSLYEGGAPVRDFVHVSDVVQANLLALGDSRMPASIFNVGSGQPTTIRQIAEAEATAMNVPAVMEDRGEFRVGDIFACYADIEGTRSALGYDPRMDLASGMAEFVAWANGQESDDAGYNRTVSELQEFGLFGRATR